MFNSDFRDLLERCASTAMSSKLINNNSKFFTKMVVDAVLTLDQEDLNEKLIGMKKVPGGGIEVGIYCDVALLCLILTANRILFLWMASRSKKRFLTLDLSNSQNHLYSLP